MTTEARALAALAAVPCPRAHTTRNGVLSCDGRHPCDLCHGTGRKLWGLTEACLNEPPHDHHWLCTNGRILVAEPEALAWLVAHLLEAGWEVRFAPDRDNTDTSHTYHVVCSRGGGKPFMRGSGPTPLLALLAAVQAAEAE